MNQACCCGSSRPKKLEPQYQDNDGDEKHYNQGNNNALAVHLLDHLLQRPRRSANRCVGRVEHIPRVLDLFALHSQVPQYIRSLLLRLQRYSLTVHQSPAAVVESFGTGKESLPLVPIWAIGARAFAAAETEAPTRT